MLRYLRPAAASAAVLVLLVANDASAHRLPAALAGAMARPAATSATRHRVTVLADPGWARLTIEPHTVFTGSGFDACSAPPLDAMRVWRGASPYGAVGIYTSGSQRACAQPELTREWVREARALGWRLMPTHVGRQAPCADRPDKPDKIDPDNAVAQGQEEAAEAVHRVRVLGLGPGTPVYLDIEAYQPGDPDCAKAVIDFTEGWTRALHLAGYFSGFYSSVDSGITDLADAARAGAAPLPDAVWYARWDNRSSTDGSGALDADQWPEHRRAHQLTGSKAQTWGGVELDVDTDQLDTLVAR
ncbi:MULTISPECIES: glycoside hydrolase domain-containing protein [Kitasatospora]|jgi:hypothetical protein|uniref:glycoside hydrolase domain-containing protein n=1 Tax=Kitasatospora TaxID=2063 RepID=UPI000C70170F|nr:glycoside hydrolase domain-containing protein [Kitasatospora sp. GP30]MDH6138129.1 hypothetical protein [Kitasatospora sp. GP30]